VVRPREFWLGEEHTSFLTEGHKPCTPYPVPKINKPCTESCKNTLGKNKNYEKTQRENEEGPMDSVDKSLTLCVYFVAGEKISRGCWRR
jgi:hypothetical protein